MLGRKSSLFLVLVLCSVQSWGQEDSNATYMNRRDVNELVHSTAPTRFGMQILSATSNSLHQDIDVTSYIFSLSHSFNDRIEINGWVPLHSGVVHQTKEFSEIGNPFLGTELKLLEFTPENPLWLSVHGGVKFSRPEEDTVASSRYQEYHAGFGITKALGAFDLSLRGTYIFKTDEAQPGIDVGNEQDASIGLAAMPSEDWTFKIGVVAKHADPLRKDGQIVVENALYTAAQPEVIFHLSATMDIMASVTVPFSNQVMDYEALKDRQQAFGDLITRSQLDKTWALGVGVAF